MYLSLYNVLALLLVVAALFGYVNHRFLRLPSTIGLMVLALVSSVGLVVLGRFEIVNVSNIINAIKQIDFQTILMQVMLSFLLFAGAIHVDAQKLGQQRVPVFTMATVGMLLSTCLVGSMLYWLLPQFGLSLPFMWCLLFGSLISPTDPIAVLGILKEARIPKQLEISIVGESLFNDGVAVVVFVSLAQFATTTGEAAPEGHNIGTLFLQEAVGGLVLGAVLGYVGYRMLRSIDNYQVEVLITLALVTGGTALATALHTSGPLAIVVAGLIIGQQGRQLGMSDTTREYVDKFWEMLDEILNAILFVLIGFEILVLRFETVYLLVGLCTIVIVLLARLIAVALPLRLLNLRRSFPQHAVKVLTWGGLRGGISVALALSLPDGEARELLVAVTYVVVVFSIIVQGLSIGPLVKRLGLSVAPSETEPLQH
ncbi:MULTISPECIES: cation:proton antiporter [Hymenobacter]|uniref:Sodium:proton antiporter n=2 Tax=Hymenobacter TaxID=89966 RepID=A0ABS6X5I9_9BACT|nr:MULTISPECIES: sodium:proton antiporter [Hymenobacter]MBO3270612.1 sodium:proton antiporter [Hymenobacter defluvii]MBW3131094.1 sodium:proton antiporter [Hymenobacter profundi]